MSIRPPAGGSVDPGTFVASEDGENFTWNGEPVTLGGGGVGAPCWFIMSGSGAMSGATPKTPQWAALDDGVAVGTDFIVHTADDTAIECVTPGTYLVTAAANVSPDASDPSTSMSVNAYVVINDDSAGPAYYAGQSLPMVAGQNSAPSAAPALPLVLDAGDLLRVSVSAVGTTLDATVQFAYMAVTRIG